MGCSINKINNLWNVPYIYDVPIEDIDLSFDKLYMFVIRDKDTGDVWLTGTVYEPLKWEDDTTRINY